LGGWGVCKTQHLGAQQALQVSHLILHDGREGGVGRGGVCVKKGGGV
jgi:hypothetical protein